MSIERQLQDIYQSIQAGGESSFSIIISGEFDTDEDGSFYVIVNGEDLETGEEWIVTSSNCNSNALHDCLREIQDNIDAGNYYGSFEEMEDYLEARSNEWFEWIKTPAGQKHMEMMRAIGEARGRPAPETPRYARKKPKRK